MFFSGGSPMASTMAACHTICHGTHLLLQYPSLEGKHPTQLGCIWASCFYWYLKAEKECSHHHRLPSLPTSKLLLHGEKLSCLPWSKHCVICTDIMMPKSNAPCWLPMALSCHPLLELLCTLTTTMRMPMAWTLRTAMATCKPPTLLTQVYLRHFKDYPVFFPWVGGSIGALKTTYPRMLIVQFWWDISMLVSPNIIMYSIHLISKWIKWCTSRCMTAWSREIGLPCADEAVHFVQRIDHSVNALMTAGTTNISHYPLDYLVDYASPTTGSVGPSMLLTEIGNPTCALSYFQTWHTPVGLNLSAMCS